MCEARADDARAAVLAHAFGDQSLSAAVIPQPARRHRVYAALMSMLVARADRIGWVRTDAAGRCVQVWFPVAADPPAVLTPEQRDWLAELAGPWANRLRALLAAQDQHHPRGIPHAYLAAIGVDPSWHGGGLGTRALRAQLHDLDHHRQPSYLEASSPASRRLYHRLGYHDCAEPITTSTGVALYPMWRLPEAGDSTGSLPPPRHRTEP